MDRSILQRRLRSWVGVAATVLACPLAAVTAHGQSLVEVMRRAAAQDLTVAWAQANHQAAQADSQAAQSARWPTLQVNGYSTEGAASLRASQLSPVAEYTVFSGGRIEAGVRRATAVDQAYGARQRTAAADAALQAADVYVAWSRTQALLDLAQDNLSVHLALLADVRKIVAVDVGRSIDLRQIEVRADGARALLTQRRMEADVARLRLRRFWPVGPQDRPGGLDEPDLRLPASLDAALDEALQQQPQLQESQARQMAAEAAVAAAQARQHPTLTASLSWVNPTGRAAGHVFQTQLSLSVPVLDAGGLRAGVEAARASRQAAELATQDLQLRLQEAAAIAWREWAAAAERLAHAERQEQLGRQLVQGYEAQFRLGRRSLLDLLNIHSESAGYQVAKVQAAHDLSLTGLRLAGALGRFADGAVPTKASPASPALAPFDPALAAPSGSLTSSLSSNPLTVPAKEH